MRLSARNQIEGTVKSVTKGATTSHVNRTSFINEAVDELGIKARAKIIVVIKASDVMIGIE